MLLLAISLVAFFYFFLLFSRDVLILFLINISIQATNTLNFPDLLLSFLVVVLSLCVIGAVFSFISMRIKFL